MTAPPRQTMLATAPVSKLIWTFAIPAILSQVVNSMHNIVDQTFLGWGIGDLAIAATNIAFPLSTLTTALAALIGMGGAAGFSLDLGKKQARSARKNWGNAIVLSVGLGCLLAVLAVAFLEPMLYLFGATEAMMIYAVPYARIISMGLPFAIFSMAMAHFIRADGSPKFSSGVLLSGAIFNMIFDPIFLFACSMGIQGVALATVLGQGLSSCLALYYLVRRRHMVTLEREDFRLSAGTIKGIGALGGAIFFNHVIMTAAQVILMNMLRTYGAQSVYGSEIAIAGSGAVGKVMIVFLSCVIGIALGCQPIFGFNYGSKRYDRVIEAYRKALRYGTTLAVIAFLCIQLFPRQILSIFGSEDPLFYEFSIHYIRIYLLMTFVNAFQPITSNFFTSIGKAKLGFWMALVRQGLLLIPLLLLLPLAGPWYGWGPLGGTHFRWSGSGAGPGSGGPGGPPAHGAAGGDPMKRDTRRAILDMAKTLFSQQGYNAVSIGEIAGALGISKGNVTYHFKRKEDIMEALLAEAKPTFFQEPPRTMEELDAFLEDMEQARENYAFYFQHHAQLGQLSPAIRARQQAIYHSQSALFAQALSILARQGMFRGEDFPGAYARVADTIFLTSLYWLPFCAVKGRKEDFRTQA